VLLSNGLNSRILSIAIHDDEIYSGCFTQIAGNLLNWMIASNKESRIATSC